MFWDPMTMDEFAMSQQAEGLKVVKTDGIWWVEIRPFFFRPLFPFAEISPNSKRYPFKAFVGGLLHLVPSGVPANTNMNFFVYDDLKNYSLDTVSNKRRRIIMQGVRNFVAKPITDLDEFVDTAYGVYISFQKRTKYSYRDDRVNKNAFLQWSRKLFDNHKTLKLGAYHQGRLSAIEISYYVEDVIIGHALFADDASLNLKVTDFLLHALRQEAADTDARYFYLGFPSGVKSLDESKLIRGSKLLRMPAYARINPVALSAGKILMNSSYRKFLDITAPPLLGAEPQEPRDQYPPET